MDFRFEPCSTSDSGAPPTGVVTLVGRLDLLSAADLKSKIHGLVSDGWTQIVVDLTGVPFVDSSGLGALVSGLKAARQSGGDFRIAGALEQVRYILQVSTLDKVLTPFATVEEGLAGYF